MANFAAAYDPNTNQLTINRGIEYYSISSVSPDEGSKPIQSINITPFVYTIHGEMTGNTSDVEYIEWSFSAGIVRILTLVYNIGGAQQVVTHEMVEYEATPEQIVYVSDGTWRGFLWDPNFLKSHKQVGIYTRNFGELGEHFMAALAPVSDFPSLGATATTPAILEIPAASRLVSGPYKKY
jgi:hypothetical protein